MLKTVVARCYEVLGNEDTAEVVDNIKNIGFELRHAVRHHDRRQRPPRARARRRKLIADAEHEIKEIDDEYEMGLITEQERYDATVEVWTRRRSR